MQIFSIELNSNLTSNGMQLSHMESNENINDTTIKEVVERQPQQQQFEDKPQQQKISPRFKANALKLPPAPNPSLKQLNNLNTLERDTNNKNKSGTEMGIVRKFQFSKQQQIRLSTTTAITTAVTPSTTAATTTTTTTAKAFNLNDVSSITTINKRQQQQQQSHQHQKYNQKLLTPTTLTTPTRFIAAKPTAVTTTTTNASTSSGVKRVNFDLPSTINETETEMENEPLLVQQQQRQANSLALASSSSSSSSLTNHSQFSLCRKPHIIFNGTYPIDMPLNNSNNYDAEANADRSELQRYRYMLHDYIIDEDAEGEEQAEAAVGYVDQEELLDYEDDEDDDDNEYVDDEDDTIDDDDYEYFVSHHNRRRTPRQRKANMYSNSDGHQSQNVWSMQELIANPSIPLNYKKMCSEVEQSLNKFEAYLDSKKQTNAVRTFDIDAPVTTAGSDGGGGGGVVGLALSSKKQL